MFTSAFQFPLIAVLFISGKAAGLFIFVVLLRATVFDPSVLDWVLMHTGQSVRKKSSMHGVCVCVCCLMNGWF